LLLVLVNVPPLDYFQNFYPNPCIVGLVSTLRLLNLRAACDKGNSFSTVIVNEVPLIFANHNQTSQPIKRKILLYNLPHQPEYFWKATIATSPRDTGTNALPYSHNQGGLLIPVLTTVKTGRTEYFCLGFERKEAVQGKNCPRRAGGNLFEARYLVKSMEQKTGNSRVNVAERVHQN